MSISILMGIMFFLSILGTIGSTIFLVYKFVKKQPRKPAVITLSSCVVAIVIFAILMTVTMTPDEKATLADRQAQKQAIELAEKEKNDDKQQSNASKNTEVAEESPREKTPTSANESPKEPSTSASTKTICTVAGIGDKLSDFKKAYGEMADMSGNKTFKSNTVAVLPLDDLAWNISVKVYSSSRLPIDVIKDFLPTDMKIIKEYSEDQFNDGNIRYIAIGESESLKTAFPKDEGKFIIIQRVYTNKSTKSYNNFVIGSGNTP